MVENEYVAELISWATWFCLIAALAMVLISVVGCHQESPAPVMSLPLDITPAQVLTKTIYQTNWLVVVGILVFAAGVYAFFTGNSKGVGIIAAGIAIGGGVLAYAAATQFTQELMKWAPWVAGLSMIGLVVAVGIYAYGHISDTVKARTHDILKEAVAKAEGVTTIADVKAVLKVAPILVFLFFASVGYAVPLSADLNHDGIVNFEDFAILADQWLMTEDVNVVDGTVYAIITDTSYYGCELTGMFPLYFDGDSTWTYRDYNIDIAYVWNGEVSVITVRLLGCATTFFEIINSEIQQTYFDLPNVGDGGTVQITGFEP